MCVFLAVLGGGSLLTQQPWDTPFVRQQTAEGAFIYTHTCPGPKPLYTTDTLSEDFRLDKGVFERTLLGIVDPTMLFFPYRIGNFPGNFPVVCDTTV